MIAEQTLTEYPVFGDNGDKSKPDDAKYSAGFLEADVLPHEWLNWFLNKDSQGITNLNKGVASMEKELISLITAAGLTPDEGTINQVLTATQQLIAAKTGDITTLTTTAKTTLVAAINELKTKNDTNASNISSHTGNRNNPHRVTKDQVGLGEVTNVSLQTIFDYTHPVNEIYVQYPGKSNPNTLYKKTTEQGAPIISCEWTDITEFYAGLFFRAEGGDSAEFGTITINNRAFPIKQDEGLPNITGKIGPVQSDRGSDNNFIMEGAFLTTELNDRVGGGNGSNRRYNPTFDASNSNDIYGNSEHVTPENTAIRIWQRTA